MVNNFGTKLFGGESTDWIFSGQQTLDGGYILSGSTASYGAGSHDAWLIKIENFAKPNIQIDGNITTGNLNDHIFTFINRSVDGSCNATSEIKNVSFGSGPVKIEMTANC